MKKKINIVWLKRDLRLQDHIALYHAESSQMDYVIIYIFDPIIINYGDLSLIHHQFVYESICKMNLELKKFNRQVLIFYGSSIDVFKFILKKYELKNILYHQ